MSEEQMSPAMVAAEFNRRNWQDCSRWLSGTSGGVYTLVSYRQYDAETGESYETRPCVGQSVDAKTTTALLAGWKAEEELAALKAKLSDAADTIRILHREKREENNGWYADAIRLTSERDTLKAQVAERAEYEGMEGRCPVGHNKRLTYATQGFVGCVACERDDALARVAALTEENTQRNARLEAACSLYCRWYDKGEPAMDASAMAYELVTAIRVALNSERLKAEQPAHPDLDAIERKGEK